MNKIFAPDASMRSRHHKRHKLMLFFGRHNMLWGVRLCLWAGADIHYKQDQLYYAACEKNMTRLALYCLNYTKPGVTPIRPLARNGGDLMDAVGANNGTLVQAIALRAPLASEKTVVEAAELAIQCVQPEALRALLDSFRLSADQIGALHETAKTQDVTAIRRCFGDKPQSLMDPTEMPPPRTAGQAGCGTAPRATGLVCAQS